MTDPELREQAATLYEHLRARLEGVGFDGTMTVNPDPDFPGGLRVTITGTATVCQIVPGLVVDDGAALPAVVEQLTRPWGPM